MTLVFLGLDGLDYELVQRFDAFDFSDDEDIPVELHELEQDMPKYISEVGEAWNNVGWWTFYLWGAIASGQIRTPEMRTEHPLPGEVEYPLKWRYIKKNPGFLKRWLLGRVKQRPRYRSFAWEDFENVKVINYPLCLPEYCEECDLFRDDASSRDYSQAELRLLAAEINTAIEQGYDAVFAVTRIADTVCHGATHHDNFNEESQKAWVESVVGQSFEEWHESGMNFEEYLDEGEVDSDEEREEKKQEIVEEVLEHVSDTYESLEALVRSINWEGVEEHVIVSDHGFDRLGAGSVKSHSPHAVLSCSFGRWRKMSQFIENWREELPMDIGEEEYEEKDTEEKVKKRLEDLGYNI